MQDRLLERIRAALPQDVSVREVTMFGGRAFMVNEKLAVSAGRDGKLLVHVCPEDQAELLRREEASQAEMGEGRSMGTGWVSVDEFIVADDEILEFWLKTALDYNRTLTN
ncbi:TfoX/Sxy family protein [Micrococcoides hystricis]|uniref:TfoX/Sxy family protein n=1 Tax=Micrococcoides hystricis TaxID=1572761 RepID=A0ABV6PDK4_9MICC